MLSDYEADSAVHAAAWRQDLSDEFADVAGNLSVPEAEEQAAPDTGFFSWLPNPFASESADTLPGKASAEPSESPATQGANDADVHHHPHRRHKVNHKDENQQLRDRLEQTEARLKHAEGIEIGGVRYAEGDP